MLNFLIIMTAEKYPNQWAVIKLCIIKELIKGLLQLMLAIFCQLFYMIIKNEVLHMTFICISVHYISFCSKTFLKPPYVYIYMYIFIYIIYTIHIYTYMYKKHIHMKTKMIAICYIMKCEWLKNESNYFVTCKYFRLTLQPLQSVTNVN